MKAFISSTYTDLKEHRQAVMNALERVNINGVHMEVFGARPEDATSVCFNEIEECDYLIGIYAYKYGFIPSNSDKSITEQEFDYARIKQKPAFCYFIDEDYPWPPKHVEGEPGQSKLREFKKKLDGLLVRETFTTSTDLAMKVGTAVSSFMSATQSNYGTSSWKEQSIWNSKKQLVDEGLDLVHQCKQSIRKIRHPGGHPDTTEWLDRINEPIFKLNSLKYKFAVVFSKNQQEQQEIENHLNEVDRIVASIMLTRQRKANHSESYPEIHVRTQSQLKQYVKEEDEFDKILYWNINGDDEIEDQLNALIEVVKKYYREVMA